MKDFVQMSAEDHEVRELLAGVDEELPTGEMEERADEIQRNTPLSVQDEESFDEHAVSLFDQTYQFETVETSVEVVEEALAEAYPDEDFTSDIFQRLPLHKYLSGEVTKFEFFMANNQWGCSFARFPGDKPIRMRKGIVSKFERAKQTHAVYHISCVDMDKTKKVSSGFTKAVLTVEAINTKDLFETILVAPNIFFCHGCEKFMFEDVGYYMDATFELPREDVWPACEKMLQLVTNKDGLDENSYASVYADKLMGIVCPQGLEPPRKKLRRGTNE